MIKKEIISDNSANSKQIEILKKYFPNCFDKNGKFISHKMQEIVGESSEFSRESYSLNWLGKSYARLLANENPLTLIKEDSEHNLKDENINSENLLIKGDNLEVLKHLRNAYSSSIKMIYIDPPYNTGNDGFVYSDDRKFTLDKLAKLAGISFEESKRILDFTSSKSNSHSAWLTFIYPRLYIARELLRDDGVIFISIDDNEVAQLKMLCDEVFGEENFIKDLIRKTKSTTNDAKIGINIQHENCLIYAKNINLINLLGGEKDLSNYKNSDNDPNGDWISDNPSAKSGSETNYFEIENPYTKKIDLPPVGMYWRFSKNTIQKHIDSGVISFKKKHKENERGFIYKRYKNRLKTTEKTLDSLVFVDNLYMNQKATKDLLDLGLAEYFTYPKGSDFIYKLLLHSTNENDIILDFFAGSGTTGDAVMQLNAEDGGNRKFILVQIAEPIDPKKNKIAYEFVKDELKKEPTIFEITKERIIRASKKIENSDIDLGFKIFEVEPIFENYLDDIEELEDETKLFDINSLNDEDIQTLLTTWKLYDGMKLSDDLKTIKLDKYIAYHSSEYIYFMDTDFTIEDLEIFIKLLDEDKNFAPSKLILFGYNFGSKIQKEIKEALESYKNKKSIELDIAIRY